MARLCVFSIYILLFSGLIACEPSRSNSHNSTTFSDDGFALDEQEESPPFVSGQRDFTRLSPVETPAVIRERETAPTATENCGGVVPFSVLKPKLIIDVDTQTMSFDFQVTSKRGTESIHLKGDFKRDEPQWRAELSAVDLNLLKDKRVEAVALCLTANICDVLGVNIYYVIENKKYCRQLRTGVQMPRVATSGDEEEPVNSTTAADDAPAQTESEEPDEGEVVEESAAETSAPTETKPSLPTPQQPVAPTPPPKQALPPVIDAPKKRVVKAEPPRLESFTKKQLDKQAIEYDGPLQISPPATAEPKTPLSGVKENLFAQAIGAHNNGRLYQADYLPLSGAGFFRDEFINNPSLTPEKDISSAWGTRRMVEFVSLLGKEVEKNLASTKITVLSVSRKLGGIRPGTCNYYVRRGKKICFGSHQTGLDVDIRYLNKNNTPGRFLAVKGNRISDDFDLARNWELAKSVTRTSQGRKEWIIVMFMDRTIKNSLCKYAKQQGETIDDPNSLAFQTLRSITHWDQHQLHFHVRLYCPGSEGCGNTKVGLPLGNGCS